MAYTNRPITETAAVVPAVADYHDRVRWGPIIAGLAVALVTQLILSALGAAVAASGIANSGAPRTNTPGALQGVGIWTVISLLISLFIGAWVMARACGPMNRSAALFNGAILWATTLALSAWLLASGVTGAFGLAVNAAASAAGAALPQTGLPTVPPQPQAGLTAQQAREVAASTATAGWSFVIGSLLGLVASLIGAAVGARSPRTTQAYAEPNNR